MLARRPLAAGERREVAGERRRVPPAPALDCADRADAEPEVVAPEPVAEVVPRPQVAAAGPLRREAEVRRLVPAVAGGGQRLDDALEVGLHRLGLALQLLAVGVREAGAGLRLELVRGDVLGLEREGLGEIAREVGGLLARDAVDEIERDVANSGITQSVEGAPDVVRLGNAIEHVEEPRAEKDWAPSETRVDAAPASSAASSGVTVSGFASTVTSSAGRQRREQALERGGRVSVGVPPPR